MSRRLRPNGQPWGVRGDAWTPEEDDWLARHIGTVPIAELAEAHAHEFSRRTETALIVRSKRLGLSRYMRGWSLREVERLFGYDHRTILRWWVEPGLLHGSRWCIRGPYPGWWFHLEDLERFVRQRGYAYDVARMDTRAVSQPLRAEAMRLAQLARLQQQADPWRSYEELRRFIGIALGNLDRWRRRGLVPCQYRPKAGPGQGYLMIRGRDFAAIREAILEARERARQAGLEHAIATRRRRALARRMARSGEVAA